MTMLFCPFSSLDRYLVRGWLRMEAEESYTSRTGNGRVSKSPKINSLAAISKWQATEPQDERERKVLHLTDFSHHP